MLADDKSKDTIEVEVYVPKHAEDRFHTIPYDEKLYQNTKLGKRVGKGWFGSVFEIAGDKTKVLKVEDSPRIIPETLERIDDLQSLMKYKFLVKVHSF